QMQQATHPFTRAAPTGRRIAVVGAGPAGLACAHRLAMKGHDVTIYDAQDKAGGLNEYGVAAYKLADDFAQHEIAFVEQIGGITVQPGHKLGRDMTVASLTAAFDAVFLAFGQSGVRALALDNEGLPGVLNAVDFIGQIRRSPTKADVPVGRRVVVIGGGNTAIDAAVQAKRLGAETVTLLYRRGTETMSATVEEQTWARNNDVLIRTWAAPTALTATPDGAVAVTFTRGRAVDGRPVYDGAPFVLEADMVLKAVGQLVMDEPAQIGGPAIRTEGGRIAVDAFGRTSEPRVYAGGDCTAGEDLTVAAVRDGRNAAETIHADLSAVKEN
ncbi:FAD-dependent oxidoreductase, partial [Ameyamaea chiangmaiensis]